MTSEPQASGVASRHRFVPSLLHVLPHSGGGGEKYIDLLESMPGYLHERAWLSTSRSPLGAGPSIAARWPRLWHDARHYDLIHLHGDVTSMFGLPLLRRQPGIVTTHGLSFLRRARGVPLHIARARYSQVIRVARRVVCSSQAERDELLALDGDTTGTRLTVIPNGIALPAPVDDDRRRAIRAELGIEDDDVAGLYLGLLDRYKDPLTAVRAAQIVRGRGVPFTLLVAGDGPLLTTVRRQAGPAVRVLGFRGDPQRLLQAADVFVMPSIREGSSYALLEAMGQGVAIVASNGAGIPELVGTTAIVAPAGDVEAFAEGLFAVASDPSRRERLGSSARARVSESFGVDRFTESMRALYEAVLAEEERR
jgi:glycosyltransferase involved in cell wall biosynthesis